MRVRELVIERPTLEQVFLSLTGEHAGGWDGWAVATAAAASAVRGGDHGPGKQAPASEAGDAAG